MFQRFWYPASAVCNAVIFHTAFTLPDKFFRQPYQRFPLFFCTEQHTVAVFRIVLKQGICPRRTFSVGIARICHGRCGSTPDWGTSCRIGNHHAFPEKLCHKLHIRGFTTPATRTGKFHERPCKLTAFDRFFGHQLRLIRHRTDSKRPVVCLFFYLLCGRLHDKRLFLCRADVRTVAAACTVERTDLYPERMSRKFFSCRRLAFKILWCKRLFLFI